MSERIPRVIAWDLDETLGQFDRFYAKLSGSTPSKFTPNILLRADMTSVLGDFAKRGFEQWIVSGSSEELVAKVLERTNLAKFFGERVWPNDLLYPQYRFRNGKSYKDFEEGRFFNDRTRVMYKDKMIVIGDAPGDQPSDLNQLVFLKDESLGKCSANLIKKIVLDLYARGGVSFFKGFKNYFERGERIGRTGDGRILLENKVEKTNVVHRRMFLDRDIFFTLTAEIVEGQTNLYFPMISEIDAPKYRKEMTVVD